MNRPALISASLLAGLVALTSSAFAQSCSALYHERNSIFAGAGYCFKTPRAIRTFGNAGCLYDSEAAVRLSPRNRARVNQIRRLEREMGC